MAKLEYTEHGMRLSVDESRHHRENIWDYKGRAVYHVTLATETRFPLFGTIAGNSADSAYIQLNDMGQFVNTTLRNLPAFYAKKGYDLRILAVRVMPDHLHTVIHVRQPIPKSIGEVVRSFKSACTSHFKRQFFLAWSSASTTSPLPTNSPVMQFCRIFATRASIWEQMPAGYHERILHCDGQLQRMIAYVKDNPRRLWLKHNNPELFKLRADTVLQFIDERGRQHCWHFRTLGNHFLKDYPVKQVIQCSRSITDEQLADKSAHWMQNAQQGAVSVTAAISEGEKTATRALREAGMQLIVLLKDGFPKAGSPHERYYKPGGVYFEACAAGRLLLMEPIPEVLSDELIAETVYRKSPMARLGTGRYHFLALNCIAEAICRYGFGQGANQK